MNTAPITDITLDSIEAFVAPKPSRAFVNSMKARGQIVPILVSAVGDKFRVISGRRRVLAKKMIGDKTVSAIVMKGSQKEEAETTLLENIQRSSNAAAEALAIQDLVDIGQKEEQIRDELGISLTTIRQRLRLLRLDPELFGRLEEGTISIRAALVATELPKEIQKELAKQKKITEDDVLNLRRAMQLSILDIDGVDIPEVIPVDEYMQLAARLSAIAMTFPDDWKRSACLLAGHALKEAADKTKKEEEKT